MRSGSRPGWRAPHAPGSFRPPPAAATGAGCFFDDPLPFERDAVRNWLGLDPGGMSAEELADALRPVVALGSADPRVGAFLLDVDAGTLDPDAWPSLPRAPVLAVPLVSEAIVRIDGGFEVDCELFGRLGLAPPRTVLQLALLVDESHGSPLGEGGVRAQVFERKSLAWECSKALDDFLGLDSLGGEGAPPDNPGGGGHGRGGGPGGDGGGEDDGGGTVPGDDRVVSTVDSLVPRGLQLLVAFRGAHRARTTFPDPARDTAVFRYRPRHQQAFEWLVALLGPAGSGAAVLGPAGGRVCGLGHAARACLELPAGALAAPVLVRIDVAKNAPPHDPADAVVGVPIRLLPDGTALAIPATLTLPIDAGLARLSLAPGLLSRAFGAEGSGPWSELPGSTADVAAGVVRAEILHFSFYQPVIAGARERTIGVEEVGTTDAAPIEGAYLGGDGDSAVVTSADPAFGGASAIYRLNRDLAGNRDGPPTLQAIVPTDCRSPVADAVGTMRGVAMVHVPDGTAAGHPYLYFTLAPAGVPNARYQLLRWDLLATDGDCAAGPFEEIFTTAQSGAGILGGLTFRRTLDPADPLATELGELYLATAETQAVATSPFFGSKITRVRLGLDGRCLPGGAGCQEEVVAGTCTPGFNGDTAPDGGLMAASAALLRMPLDLAAGSTGPLALSSGRGGDVLFVADSGNHRIRAINVGTGTVTLGGQDIGPGQIATLSGTAGCAVTQTVPGNLCSSIPDPTDPCDDLAYRSDPCGRTPATGTDGGLFSQLDLALPTSIAVGPTELYVTESCRNHVLVVTVPEDGSDGLYTLLAGDAELPGFDFVGEYTGFQAIDAPQVATLARFSGPQGLWLGEPGELFVADTGNGKVRRVRFHDADLDGVADYYDSCPLDANPPDAAGAQPNTDGDLLGDACDPCPSDPGNWFTDGVCQDRDGDWTPNDSDNCPDLQNPEQEDFDRDGAGDACDDDDDGDGVLDLLDSCPLLPNGADARSAADTDRDSVGDVCDDDDDGDGVLDLDDNCPYTWNPMQEQSCEDGIGDACSVDRDHDGLTDAEEAQLGTDPCYWDTDGDFVGDRLEVLRGTNPLMVDIFSASDPVMGNVHLWRVGYELEFDTVEGGNRPPSTRLRTGPAHAGARL